MGDEVDFDELMRRDWPAEGVSIKEFTRIIGLKSDNSVRKAIKAERITPLSSGKIDVKPAIMQWKSRTLPHQQRAATAATSAGDDAAQLGENVVPLRPGDKGGAPGPDPLAEHVRKNRERRTGSDVPPPPPDDGSGDSLTTAQLSNAIQRENLRYKRLLNDALEGDLLARHPALVLMETFARDTQATWLQYVDRFTANVAERLGFGTEEGRRKVFIVLRETVDQHLAETVKKMTADKYCGRFVPGKVANGK